MKNKRFFLATWKKLLDYLSNHDPQLATLNGKDYSTLVEKLNETSEKISSSVSFLLQQKFLKKANMRIDWTDRGLEFATKITEIKNDHNRQSTTLVIATIAAFFAALQAIDFLKTSPTPYNWVIVLLITVFVVYIIVVHKEMLVP